MSKSVNHVALLGYVGNDPEIRTTASGMTVAKFSLATDDYAGKDANGKRKEKTNWHRITAFSHLAEIVETYVHKADRLFVAGRIEYSTTEGDDGHTRYWTDIVINDLVMLNSLDGKPHSRPEKAGTGMDGDLPF